ncbi:deoxynucleoside triphosphate triphosphohydrolase SAMHD1-like [Epinephelus lanceolatus]
MIAEAFVKADEHIQIKGSGGKMFTLSTAIDDMEAFTKLTDRVFEQILNSYSPTMAEARQILTKTISENLSEIVRATKSKQPSEPTKEQIDRWRKELAELDGNSTGHLGLCS